MRRKMARWILCPILIIGISGCCSVPVQIDIPPRPELIPIEAELQEATPPIVLERMAINMDLLKTHIKKLEKRIELANESR